MYRFNGWFEHDFDETQANHCSRSSCHVRSLMSSHELHDESLSRRPTKSSSRGETWEKCQEVFFVLGPIIWQEFDRLEMKYRWRRFRSNRHTVCIWSINVCDWLRKANVNSVYETVRKWAENSVKEESLTDRTWRQIKPFGTWIDMRLIRSIRNLLKWLNDKGREALG